MTQFWETVKNTTSLWLVFAFLGIALIAKVGGAEISSSLPMTGAEIATTSAFKSNVTLAGRLTDRRPSRNGHGLIFILQSEDGYQTTCYISPDVVLQPIRANAQLQVIGSIIGPGVLSISHPSGVKVLANGSSSRSLTGKSIVVRHGWAHVQRGSTTVKMWANRLPDGVYTNLEMQMSASGYPIVLEANTL